MRIKYLKKVSVDDIFECQICSKVGREQYVATPSLPGTVGWDELKICKKCARREIGSKNKKGWDKIHEEATSG